MLIYLWHKAKVGGNGSSGLIIGMKTSKNVAKKKIQKSFCEKKKAEVIKKILLGFFMLY